MPRAYRSCVRWGRLLVGGLRCAEKGGVPSFLLRLTYADMAGRQWVTTARYLFPRERYDDLDLRSGHEGSYGLKQDTELLKPATIGSGS
jgi:hypothetical protein